MSKIYLFTIIIFNFGSFLTPSGYSQEINLKNNLNSTKTHKIEMSVVDQVEEGINQGDIAKLKNHFTSQPYISLLNGVNGYYSLNQVYYIFEKFFQDFKVLSFKFENKRFENNAVYGTGIYYYERKGKRESAFLYVTLIKIGNKWSLSQISIN